MWMSVVLAIGQFKIMAMKSSTIIIYEVHGHNQVPCVLVTRSPLYTVDEVWRHEATAQLRNWRLLCIAAMTQDGTN